MVRSSAASRMVLLIAGGLLLVLSNVPAASQTTKGAFAFHYASSLTDAELLWLSRFRLVVPGDILPAPQVSALRAAGARLFFYEWATGLYIDDPSRLAPGSWEATVWANRARWLLNPDAPDAGPDGRWRTYYYDPAPADLRTARINRLDGLRRRAAYRGVFFDLVGSPYVPAALLDVYRARHPRRPFDRMLAELLRGVAERGSVVFTNQGYRTPASTLPATDIDLTESLMTSYASGEPVRLVVEGEGLVDRWETSYRPWSELQWIVDEIQARVDRYGPHVRVMHLNHVNPRYVPTGGHETIEGVRYPVYRAEVDRPAIVYAYAAAKLWGHPSYSTSVDIRTAADVIDFADLGQPLGRTWQERDGAVVRHYRRGVVVVATSTDVVSVDLSSSLVPAGVTSLDDLFAGVRLVGLTAVLEPTRSEASGRLYPAGRVYRYALAGSAAVEPSSSAVSSPRR